MNMAYIIELVPKMIECILNRIGLIRTPMPLTITYSVTNMCQSRCKTCYIWKVYLNDRKKRQEELKIQEIEKIFKSIGHIYFFNISGGEPFLRKDLPEIVELACKYLKPGVIHVPTNGIASKVIEKKTKKILETMKNNDCNIPFTIKPSFDAVGKKHDEIRGVKGNFKKVIETVKRLKKLQRIYGNLDVGLGTVISKFNIDINTLKDVSDYAKKLDVDSYINEIAEQRSELFTLDKDITPSSEDYKRAINYFKNFKTKKKLSKYTQAFRIVYYDLVVRILKERRQVIPCYAGISNAHISPYGDVWPCCVLGYNKSMGNLKDMNYDFKKIWYSKKANEIRKYIRKKKCYCPLANQAYSNILMNPVSMIKVLKIILF